MAGAPEHSHTLLRAHHVLVRAPDRGECLHALLCSRVLQSALELRGILLSSQSESPTTAYTTESLLGVMFALVQVVR
jgi:hypothetical protein